MPIQLRRGERDPQRIIDAIMQLATGRQDSVGDVTLRPNQATTVVSFANCSTDSRVFLFPQTANAAAAVPTTYILQADILRRSFTIRHANNAQVDKTFSYLVIGG